MKKHPLLAEFLFWFHVVVVLAVVGLFFVPRSLWPARVAFHFWFVILVFLLQVVTGIWLTKYRSFALVCPVTTLTQYVRGYKVSSPKNHSHGCIAEFSTKVGLPLRNTFIRIAMLIIVTLVSIQYYLYIS